MAIIIQIKTKTESYSVELKNDPLIIGRSSSADVSVTSENLLSRQHLEIFRHKSGHIFIRDLGSKNGTKLNFEMLLQESIFYIEDIISVGQMQITLDQSQMDENEIKRHTRSNGKTQDEKSNTSIVRDTYSDFGDRRMVSKSLESNFSLETKGLKLNSALKKKTPNKNK